MGKLRVLPWRLAGGERKPRRMRRPLKGCRGSGGWLAELSLMLARGISAKGIGVVVAAWRGQVGLLVLRHGGLPEGCCWRCLAGAMG